MMRDDGYAFDEYYEGGRRETLLEIAAYCDEHASDASGGSRVTKAAWVNAMRDVATHCRALAAGIPS